MDLAIAGMLSGAGKAGTAALQSTSNLVEHATLQSWLQGERDKMEAEREARRQEFESQQTDKKIAAEQASTQSKMGMDVLLHGQTEQNAQDLAATRERGETERHKELKDLEIQRNKTAEEYYKGRGGGKGDSLTAKKLDTFEKDMERTWKTATDSALGEAERKAARTEYDAAKRNRDAILGITGSAPSKGINPGGYGKYLQGEQSNGPAPTVTPPAGVTEDFTVQRTRPTIPRGRIEPGRASQLKKQQLDYDVQMKSDELAQAKIHGNAALVSRLQSELAALEAQQTGAASGPFVP